MYRTVKFITVPLLFSNVLFAQAGLKVHITDSASGKPVAYVSIVVAKEYGKYRGGYGESFAGTTDSIGWTEIEPIDTGIYTILAGHHGYYNSLTKGIVIKPSEVTQREIRMKPDSKMARGYSITDEPKQKDTLKKE